MSGVRESVTKHAKAWKYKAFCVLFPLSTSLSLFLIADNGNCRGRKIIFLNSRLVAFSLFLRFSFLTLFICSLAFLFHSWLLMLSLPFPKRSIYASINFYFYYFFTFKSASSQQKTQTFFFNIFQWTKNSCNIINKTATILFNVQISDSLSVESHNF